MADQSANAHLPVTNRPETVLGTTISFLIVAWLGVSLRLWVRYKERMWGWDDFLLFIAIISTTGGSTIICLMPSSGVGKHFWTLDNDHIMGYFKWVWASNVTYTSSTALIKLAILLQYLRLFEMQSGLARRLTMSFIVIIAVWGLTFFWLAVFACVPIKKNWDFNVDGQCVAWGSKNPDILFASFAAHSATNMLFDFLVWILPIPFLRSLRMRGRTRVGIIALFFVGSIVTIISIARIIVLSYNRAGTVPNFDPSFAAPAIFILSVLEVNVAILCATIPIFWPLVASLTGNKILVVQEVTVRTDRRQSGFADQESGYAGLPDDAKDGRSSRAGHLNVVIASKGERLARSGSRLHKHTRKSSSTSSHNGAPIELGHRISQDSTRNFALKSSSNNSLGSNSPDLDAPLTTTSSLSAGRKGGGGGDQWSDRYQKEWAAPDFDKPVGSTYTTTVERAEIPFDHIRSLEK